MTAQRQAVRAAFGHAAAPTQFQRAAEQRRKENIGGPAVLQCKVGFEFQMLASEVTLRDKNKDAEKITWAGKQGWHIERDGKNIEFVTKAVETREQATNMVEEIQAVAAKVKNTGTYKDNPQAKDNACRKVNVVKTDTEGQPQINVDVSLSKFIAGTKGYTKGDEDGNAKYFGAEFEDFGWSQDKTETMLARGDSIRTEMADISNDMLLYYLFKATRPGYHIGNTNQPKQAKVLEILRAYCILQATILETAPTSKGLTKDMPVLPKTNLKSMLDLLKKAISDALVDSNRISQEKGDEITIDETFPDIIPKLRKASGSGRGEVDLFEETDDSRHVYGVKAGKGFSSGQKPSLLMEYRRVPITPVEGWAALAGDAADDLGTENQ